MKIGPCGDLGLVDVFQYNLRIKFSQRIRGSLMKILRLKIIKNGQQEKYPIAHIAGVPIQF